jgi:hypothetical protein
VICITVWPFVSDAYLFDFVGDFREKYKNIENIYAPNHHLRENPVIQSG